MVEEQTEGGAPSSKAVMHSQEKVLEAANFCKLGMANELKQCLKMVPPGSVNHQDAEGAVLVPLSQGAPLRSEGMAGVLATVIGLYCASKYGRGFLSWGQALRTPCAWHC